MPRKKQLPPELLPVKEAFVRCRTEMMAINEQQQLVLAAAEHLQNEEQVAETRRKLSELVSK